VLARLDDRGYFTTRPWADAHLEVRTSSIRDACDGAWANANQDKSADILAKYTRSNSARAREQPREIR